MYDYLRRYRRSRKERAFYRQGLTKITCGVYEIEAPESHLLIELQKSQPYRDLCLGISAKCIVAKYPSGTIVDIGANIGDTAAIISTHASPNKLILIEGSDYFFDILVRNVSQLPGNIVCKKVLVSDVSEATSGAFIHWGGTAYFHEEAKEAHVPAERLVDLVDENTRLIKSDADGYDFRILIDSLDWLAQVHPAIMFENQIRNGQDLDAANELCTRFVGMGYVYFIVWDDPGFHLVSTSSLEILADLNRYLFKVWQNDGHKSIYNYDILCLHRDDGDVYNEIRRWYKEY
jgi:FkbM family methyltransferase